ncbi:membrane protein insertase YidC [Blastococcus brunescens]|uniref:Membrane protein insertase YidC n=1 Tax=Blastococcus brunescens TaxID=1564165 RepID=A0ABZ1AZ20_9ACTN|nr:membrane protein insertase YidC [Blastococcus sp. BMG 8361]WRL63804.1 membrane protein insertase YidC [Blastococcus sp. BMG 8361]
MLDWLYTGISWVMARWHSLWDLVFGNPPAESALGGLSWVLAIVFLVVTIRLILFPLFVKQIKSQRAMQELQPELAKLRKQYGSDRQGMAVAQQALMKERGVNPWPGACRSCRRSRSSCRCSTSCAGSPRTSRGSTAGRTS